MAVLNAVSRVLLHFREHVADDLGRIVWRLLWPRDLPPGQRESPKATSALSYVHRHIAELRPAQSMVHVVFAEVVLRQVRDVRLLDVRDVRGVKDSDVHICGILSVCPLVS